MRKWTARPSGRANPGPRYRKREKARFRCCFLLETKGVGRLRMGRGAGTVSNPLTNVPVPRAARRLEYVSAAVEIDAAALRGRQSPQILSCFSRESGFSSCSQAPRPRLD